MCQATIPAAPFILPALPNASTLRKVAGVAY